MQCVRQLVCVGVCVYPGGWDDLLPPHKKKKKKPLLIKFCRLNKLGDLNVPVTLFYNGQSSRIDDQRCSPPEGGPHAPTVPDEDFFSLIQRVQAKRMDEQRVHLPTEDEDGDQSSPEPEAPGGLSS